MTGQLLMAISIIFGAFLLESEALGNAFLHRNHGKEFTKICNQNDSIRRVLAKVSNHKNCRQIYLSVRKRNSLILSHVKSKDISWLSSFTKLKSLTIRNSKIEQLKIPATLKNLEYLNLSGGSIKEIEIPTNILKIKSIDLSENKIEILPKLDHLTNLRSLNLNNNKIKDISGLGVVKSLMALDLSYNQIIFATGLRHLVNLTHLNLSYNKIGNLKFLSDINRLRSLYFSHNQIEDIKPLSKSISIQRLDLSGNHIKKIKSIHFMKNLKFLNLSDNEIDNIRFLSGLSRLNRVDLSQNNVEDIRILSTIDSLTYLNLSNNNIKFASSLKNIRRLQYVDLRENPLNDLRNLKRHLYRIKEVIVDRPENKINKKPKPEAINSEILYDNSNQTINSAGNKFVFYLKILISFAIIIFLIVFWSLWLIFEKFKFEGWKALIPGYNLYIITIIAKKPTWWCWIWITSFLLIFFDPSLIKWPLVAGLVSLAIFLYSIASFVLQYLAVDKIRQRFKKHWLYSPGLILVPFVFFPILALSNIPRKRRPKRKKRKIIKSSGSEKNKSVEEPKE